MYVAIVPNRSSRPAILLRESYRDGARVKNRTLANLSDWPPEQVESLRMTLGLGEVNVKEIYAALDWLGMAQSSIENAWRGGICTTERWCFTT
jgi:hypothetical protein